MPSAKKYKTYRWEKLAKESLLDQRISDLGLQIPRGRLEPRIEQLYRELDKKGLVFRPHCWLSDEWYCPDGIPGFAIPFYLAHRRLISLEKDYLLEAEGSDKRWCMRLLRHETGHALLNAYQLHKRTDWKRMFGKPSTPYPDIYLPKPYSKKYVLNLPNWYAQSHPHEDWAETFAVWLTPKSDWRKKYKSWPAFKKLCYVDGLMKEIAQKSPRLRNHQVVFPADRIKMTLRAYYTDKIERYKSDGLEFFDRDLRKLFSDHPDYRSNEKASRYIRRTKREILDIVERWTHEYKYRINEVLSEMIKKCDQLDLHITADDETVKTDLVAFLTMLVMNKLHSGGFHVSL